MRLRYPNRLLLLRRLSDRVRQLGIRSERMAPSGLDPVAGFTPSHETSQRNAALSLEYPFALMTPADQTLCIRSSPTCRSSGGDQESPPL